MKQEKEIERWLRYESVGEEEAAARGSLSDRESVASWSVDLSSEGGHSRYVSARTILQKAVIHLISNQRSSSRAISTDQPNEPCKSMNFPGKPIPYAQATV